MMNSHSKEDLFYIDSCLESMEILVDTREQPSKRAKDRYKSFQCPYQRRKLEYGDYTYNFRTPDGEWLFPDDQPVLPVVAIERKMNLDELAQCFTKERKRFEAEFERAKEAGAKIYLLVENASYENLYNGKYRSRFNPAAYTASVWAWVARYNLIPIFCKEETSGKVIRDILYRELKQRLEQR